MGPHPWDPTHGDPTRGTHPWDPTRGTHPWDPTHGTPSVGLERIFGLFTGVLGR